jgi:hypothetical protein
MVTTGRDIPPVTSQILRALPETRITANLTDPVGISLATYTVPETTGINRDAPPDVVKAQ